MGTQISEENVTQGSRSAPVDGVAHKIGTDPKTVYCRHMNKTQNPYRLQMIQQGRDPIDRPVREVPARFRDRFATYEEYQEAMADFLNGM
jgi:hypothetical protein